MEIFLTGHVLMGWLLDPWHATDGSVATGNDRFHAGWPASTTTVITWFLLLAWIKKRSFYLQPIKLNEAGNCIMLIFLLSPPETQAAK